MENSLKIATLCDHLPLGSFFIYFGLIAHLFVQSIMPHYQSTSHKEIQHIVWSNSILLALKISNAAQQCPGIKIILLEATSTCTGFIIFPSSFHSNETHQFRIVGRTIKEEMISFKYKISWIPLHINISIIVWSNYIRKV